MRSTLSVRVSGLAAKAGELPPAERRPSSLSTRHTCTYARRCARHPLIAEMLSARRARTIHGNGNVPPLCAPQSSWQSLWRGVPRIFRSPSLRPPDIVLINHGTNDGLNSAAVSDVSQAVEHVLQGLRTQCGPDTHLFVIVPFGGWCARQQPQRALLTGYENYQSSSADPRAHLIDLGSVRPWQTHSSALGLYRMIRHACAGAGLRATLLSGRRNQLDWLAH